MSDSTKQDGGRLFNNSKNRMTAEILTPKEGATKARIRVRYHGVNLGIFSGVVYESKTK